MNWSVRGASPSSTRLRTPLSFVAFGTRGQLPVELRHDRRRGLRLRDRGGGYHERRGEAKTVDIGAPGSGVYSTLA